jgi:hypothetical protein
MRKEVLVQFSEGREFELPVSEAGMISPDAARRWLDDEFLANGCEPLRATGKVLTADKVLVLAETVGPDRFESDPGWAAAFARAALGALGRATVQVDVDAGTVTF